MIPDSKRLITMWDLPLNRGGIIGGLLGASPFLWHLMSQDNADDWGWSLLPLLCVGSLAGNKFADLLARIRGCCRRDGTQD